MINKQELKQVLDSKGKTSGYLKLSADELRKVNPDFVKAIEENGETVEEYFKRVRASSAERYQNKKKEALKKQNGVVIDSNQKEEVKHSKPRKTTGRLKQLSDYIEQNPNAKNAEICQATGIHPSYLPRLLSKLK